ncbi:hypothetical protein HAX54_003402, partial [Datura stramonium]|nr:hypothetical protein [Datura stramonium]
FALSIYQCFTNWHRLFTGASQVGTSYLPVLRRLTPSTSYSPVLRRLTPSKHSSKGK